MGANEGTALHTRYSARTNLICIFVTKYKFLEKIKAVVHMKLNEHHQTVEPHARAPQVARGLFR